jgi:hypothetical protein
MRIKFYGELLVQIKTNSKTILSNIMEGYFTSQFINQKRFFYFLYSRKKLHVTELDHKEIPTTAKSIVFLFHAIHALYCRNGRAL